MRQAAKFVALQMLRGYKWAISPMFPPACRFVPTCSEYAMEAVERYGVLRGGWMAMARLLRCHPFARGGHDPVVKAGSQRLKRCATQNQTAKPEYCLVADVASRSRASSKQVLPQSAI
jgi:putative membrane protein insertion efficiency factor